MAVAKASGVRLATMQGHDMEKMLGGETPLKRMIAYLVLPFAMQKHKKLVSGMLKDILGGRKCEIDFVNGVVVREGEKVGVKTPFCQKIVEITHGIEDGIYQIGYQNTELFN
jgi:2-dehydropantoate 2-reductase